METDVYLGIDGGGTHTRAAVTDWDGNLLAYVCGGAVNFKKDRGAAENMRAVIGEALARAGRTPEQVRAVAAGVAGYDGEEDRTWVEALTRMEGMNCAGVHVNDAEAAQAGAFALGPGIVAVSGTGAVVFGVMEDGRRLNNYRFGQFTASTARYLAYQAVYCILSGETDESDAALIREVLDDFGLNGVEELRELACRGFMADGRERDRRFGALAPAVTRATENGSRLAGLICSRAAEGLNTGIRLVGSCFSSDCVPVAFEGSVIRSGAVCRALTAKLAVPAGGKSYRVVPPQLPAALGGVLLAMRHVDAPVTERILTRLRAAGETIARAGL